jgi:hypothetical protein
MNRLANAPKQVLTKQGQQDLSSAEDQALLRAIASDFERRAAVSSYAPARWTSLVANAIAVHLSRSLAHRAVLIARHLKYLVEASVTLKTPDWGQGSKYLLGLKEYNRNCLMQGFFNRAWSHCIVLSLHSCGLLFFAVNPLTKSEASNRVKAIRSSLYFKMA